MPHGQARFEAAQTFVRWHYQWLVMNEFLPRLVGAGITTATMDNPPYEFQTEHAFMPVEFSVAAYRFGHSQVRPGYLVGQGRGAALFPGDPNAPFTDAAGNPQDLRGFRPVPPQLQVDWSSFFERRSGQQEDRHADLDQRLAAANGVVPKEVEDLTGHLASGTAARLRHAPERRQTLALTGHRAPLSEAEIWTTMARRGKRTGARCGSTACAKARSGTGGARLDGVGAAIVARTSSR